ncbi:MAG: FAD-dependent oxidoreductase [Bacteroidota bacterium]|nr:FAD-dependent oxidoreductase [Bacteroidota bacterium]
MSLWDIIVIGGGCNGLAAAALMAQHGRRTLLLEQRSVVGGLSGAFTYRRDRRIDGMRPFAGGCRIELLKPLGITSDTLKSTSDRWTFRDVEGRTFTPADTQGYDRYQAFLDHAVPVLRQICGAHARPYRLSRITRSLSAALRSGPSALRSIARTAPLSAQDFLDEFFTCDRIKGALVAPLLLRTQGGPWTPFGALQLMLHQAAGGGFGPSGPELARALYASAQAAGVIIRTGRRAVGLQSSKRHWSVALEDDSSAAARDVIPACSPRLLSESLLDPALTAGQPAFRTRGTCALLTFETDSPTAPLSSTRIQCSLGMTAMERAFDCVKHGRVPHQQVLLVTGTALEAGGQSVRIHALQTPSLPAQAWTRQARETLVQRILTQLRAHLPELEGEIGSAHLWTPADLAEEFLVPGGHLWHFERDLDQLTHPPSIPALDGLYPGESHMESGYVCASGLGAARRVLRDRNRI